MTLATIRRDVGLEFVQNYIALWLLDYNALVNSANKLTDEQIERLGEDLYSEYYYLNAADINLIFKRAAKSELYNRLDYFVVMKWFSDYATERAGIAENQQYTRQTRDPQVKPMGCIRLNSDELNTVLQWKK